jgi:hypothetical protein
MSPRPKRKLSLVKETLRRLDSGDLSRIQGGSASTFTCGCGSAECQSNEMSICYTHCNTAYPCDGCVSLSGQTCSCGCLTLTNDPWGCMQPSVDVSCQPE